MLSRHAYSTMTTSAHEQLFMREQTFRPVSTGSETPSSAAPALRLFLAVGTAGGGGNGAT